MLPRATAGTRGRLAKLAASALLTLGLLPALAHGAAAPVLIFQNGGATLPGAVIRTPDGGLWITDPSGVCRITAAPAAPSLVAGPFCAAVAHQGPNKPDKMAFDPATNNFYVSDLGSEVPPVPSGIWRMHWSPVTGAIDAAVQIVVVPAAAGNPPQGVSFATPGGVPVLDFSTKRDTFIFRLTNPQLCPQAPSPTCPTDVIVGNTTVPGATTIAHALGGTTLYDIEDIGVLAPFPVVARIDGLDPTTHPGGQVVAGLPVGTPNALVADPGGAGRPNVVYVGTANVNATPGSDEVWAINPATQASQVYAPASFAGVSGLGVDASPAATGGTLYVADDIFAASGSPAPGGGRVWSVARVDLRPGATMTQSPGSLTNNPVVTFAFTKGDPASAYFCSLDGAAPVRCDVPGGASGSAVYGPLGDGAHRFELRSLAATELPIVRLGFTVDTVGPNVALAGVKVAGTGATITFAADELNTLTRCSLDGAAAARCDSPFVVGGLGVGPHSVVVSATDLAGNTGRPALAGFSIAPAATPPAGKSPARRKAVASIASNGRMTIAFQAAADAKVARIVLSGLRVKGKTSKSVARLVLPVRGLKPGKWNVVHRRLTAAQLRALRAGTRVAISVRAGKSEARLLVTDRLTIRIPAPPAGGPDAVPKRKPVKR